MKDLFWRQIQNFSVRLKSKQTPEIKIEIEKNKNRWRFHLSKLRFQTRNLKYDMNELFY